MKTNKVVLIVGIICLMILSACSNSSQGTKQNQIRPIEQSAISTESDAESETAIVDVTINENSENNSNSSTVAGISFQGGYDVFDRRYIDVVENLNYGSMIVGEEATQEWVDNFYLKQNEKEQIELPGLYQMIKYFKISKNDLIKVNESFKDQGFYESVIPDEVIEALYAPDEKIMKKALASPIVLYYNGMIYTVNDLKKMSLNDIKKIGISSSELATFVNQIDIYIKANVSEKLYDLNYKDTIQNIKKMATE